MGGWRILFFIMKGSYERENMSTRVWTEPNRNIIIFIPLRHTVMENGRRYT